MADYPAEWVNRYFSALSKYLSESDSTAAIAQSLGSRAASHCLSLAHLSAIHTTVLELCLQQCVTQADCIQTALRASGFLEQCLQAFERQPSIGDGGSGQPESAQHRGGDRPPDEELWQIADNLQDLVFLRTIETGELLYVNSVCETLYQRSHQEVYQQSYCWLDQIHPEDRDRIESCLKRELQGQAFLNEEYRIIRPDGSLRWIWNLSFPIRNAAGEIHQVAGINRDVTERKQAEMALKASEERYRQIVETATEGIWMLDAAAHTTFVNPKMATMLGYSVESMLGMSLFEFMDEEGRAIATAFLNRRQQGITEQHEFKFQRRDGSALWTLVSTRPIINAAGQYTGTLGLITDMSDRKALELSLQKTEAQLNALLNGADAAIISLRLSNQGDLTREYISAGCERLYGYTAEEFGSNPLLWETLVFPEDLARLLPNSASLYSSQNARNEFRIRHKDGTVRWISSIRTAERNEVEKHWHIIIVETDVTLYKQVEAALRISEERYRAAIEDQTELICRFLPDGTLTLVNAAYCRYFERAESELVGSNFLDLVPQEDRDQVRQDLQELCTLTPENHLVIQEHAVVQPDGKVAWQEWTNRAIFDPQGQLLEFQAVGRDTSDRKQAELALQQLNQELEQRVQQRTEQLASELRQKEVLLREVHHRVKNNLQVISSMLRLQAQSAAEPQVQSALEDSQRRVRAIALTHELLYQTRDLEEVAFDQYIQQLCNAILSAQSMIQCSIQIIYQLEPTFLDLQTTISCGLLVNELVTNAIKHAFPGRTSGKIQITLAQVPASEAAQVSLARSRAGTSESKLNFSESLKTPYYSLIIQDDGVGISPGLNLKTLESLGLQIAYDLARQIRGNLDFVRNSGTRFQLLFPKSAD